MHELAVPPYIRSLAVSRDGKYLAAGTGTGFVKIWETAQWTELGSFSAHTGIVFSVTFSHDGQSLASAGADGSVKLWDVPAATGIITTAKAKEAKK